MRVLHREDGRLIIMGLDCFDGTLVLDIKPYRNDYRKDKYELVGWYRKLRERVGREI